jgi:asparagine synthase (glutamine-hydrolysing)
LGSPPRPDRTAAARYLFYGYSPSPDALVEGVRKLLPGEVLTLERGDVRRRRFWEPPETDPSAAPLRDSDRELRRALSDAVQSRLVSDVPLGAFLSGGVDSTLVVDRMAALSSAPATFSIGYSDASYDESEKARSVARRVGTRHTDRVFSEESLVALLGSLPKIVDEPLADASILPTYLLSGLAREEVTVACPETAETSSSADIRPIRRIGGRACSAPQGNPSERRSGPRRGACPCRMRTSLSNFG